MSRPDLFDEHCDTCGKVIQEAPYYEGNYNSDSRMWLCDNCYSVKEDSQ